MRIRIQDPDPDPSQNNGHLFRGLFFFLAGGEGGGGVNSKLPLLPLPSSSAGLNSLPELWYGKFYSHTKKQINYPIKHCCGSEFSDSF
jgi:hypothetical protein